jgi:hypothetical protein
VLFLDFNSFHAEVAFRIGIYGAYPGFCWRFRIVRVKRLFYVRIQCICLTFRDRSNWRKLLRLPCQFLC